MSQAQTGGGLTRRRYMQLVAAGAATAAVGGRLSIGRAQAGIWDTATDVATATGTGLYMMTGLGVADFASDDWGVFQDDYQVAEAQMDAAIRTAITMRDADDRELSMAWNMLENAREVAWIEAEGAAIQPMREGKTEAEVIETASQAAADYLSGTVETNVLNHWNAQVSKIEDMIARFQEHEDIDGGQDWSSTNNSSPNRPIYTTAYASYPDAPLSGGVEVTQSQYEMLNGDSKDVKELRHDYPPNTAGSDLLYRMSPTGVTSEWYSGEGGNTALVLNNTTTNQSVLWLGYSFDYASTWDEQKAEGGVSWADQSTMNKWLIVMDRIQTIYDDVVVNVEQWASEAYGALQAGDVDMTDVISPTVMASEMSTRYDETGHLAYAAAGLAAMNLSVDYENMMTFELSDGSTFQGTLFVDVDSFDWEVGETINPSNVDGGIYAAVDSSTYSRSFGSDHYREQIDGGEVVFKSQPIDEAIYHVETNKDEAVSIEGSSFEQTDPDAKPEINPGSTDWRIDLSDRLESPIAEVSAMSLAFPESVESETIKLNGPFQITDAYDVESGESVDQVGGESEEDYKAQSAEELESILQKHREYLDDAGAFESDSAPGGGGGGGVNLDLGLGGGGFLDFLTNKIMGVPVWAILITGGAALVFAR